MTDEKPFESLMTYSDGYKAGLKDGKQQGKQEGRIAELETLDKWVYGFHSKGENLLSKLRKRNQNRMQSLKSQIKTEGEKR